MSNTICFINNNYEYELESRITTYDRGYLFADSVYEVILYNNHILIDFKEHIERLFGSMHLIHMTNFPYAPTEIETICYDLIRKNNAKDMSSIYIQVSRDNTKPRNHVIAEDGIPSMFATVHKAKTISDNLYLDGVKVMTIEEIRWKIRDAKTTLLLPNVLAKNTAKNKGYYDALFVENNFINEGTSCNFFILTKQGDLVTPIANQKILNGITRRRIIDLAQKENFKVIEREININELNDNIQGAFLTSTTIKILPIVQIDDLIINNGWVHNNVKTLMSLYKNYIN